MGNIVPRLKKEEEIQHTVQIYSDGDKYSGELAGEIREGFGVYFFSNGDKYEGEWHNNLKQGKGIFYYSNGELYMGEWADNKRNGRGMYFYQNGARYDGEWKDHMKDGEGTYYGPDHSVFYGHFKMSKRHGHGILKLLDGTIYQEEWNEDQLIKKKLIQKAGSINQKWSKEMKDLPKLLEARADQDTSELDTSGHNTSHIKGKLMIRDWNSQDICNWLDLKGFTEYKLNFIKNHITGKNLFDLTENDLTGELNIKDDNHRKRIIKEIKALQKLASKNLDMSAYIHHQLLKFLKKNKEKFFQKKSVISAGSSPDKNLNFLNNEATDNKPNNYTEETKDRSVAPENVAPKMSEYHTILDTYEHSDHNLLKTIQNTLSQLCLVDYSELKIGERIGEGGYGEVFKGKWLEEDIAIKFFGRKNFFSKEIVDNDFLKEVAVISGLSHPNIILFMGVSITPQNKGLLITEYLEGGSLFDHLHNKGTNFDDSQIIKIALSIALGMNYLHSRKILHCDLKSSNILLDDHLNVKLGDFGLSKLKKKLQGKKHFKRIGTVHWMAPEIMREEEYDESSDVYSYGMVLCNKIRELLTNKVPFREMKIYHIIGAVGYGEKQVEIPDNLDEVLSVLLQKCLAKEKKERPTFKKIVKYLREYEKNRKLVAVRELEEVFS